MPARPQAQLEHPYGDGQHSSHRKAINMSGNCTSWSSERIELLKRCFHAGLSCSQIAREIGITRNAVIGKMNRLGLSHAIATPPEQGHAAGPAGAKPPRP